MEALDTLDDSTARTLRSAPLLRHILTSPADSRSRSMTASHRLRPHHHSRIHQRRAPFRLPATVGNPDLAVLRPENQHQTHVTPRIAALATGLFREQLVVLGRRLPAPRFRRQDVSTGERNVLVRALAMALCAEGTQNIEAPVDWRIHPRRPFMRRIALCDVRGLLPKVVFEVRLCRRGGQGRGLSRLRVPYLGWGRRTRAHRRGRSKKGPHGRVASRDTRVLSYKCTTCGLFLVSFRHRVWCAVYDGGI